MGTTDEVGLKRKLEGENESSPKRVRASKHLEAFKQTLKLGVPISTVISIQNLGQIEDLSELVTVFEGLTSTVEVQGKTGDRNAIQTAVLDVAEFMAQNHSRLCTKDAAILVQLRKIVVRFEELVKKLKTKFDYRVISIFMDNDLGGEKVSQTGTMGSLFRKIKGKLFRAESMTWEQRDQIVDKMLHAVNDKRRAFLTEGRPEVRGYKDMSDGELKAWLTFTSEIHTE